MLYILHTRWPKINFNILQQNSTPIQWWFDTYNYRSRVCNLSSLTFRQYQMVENEKDHLPTIVIIRKGRVHSSRGYTRGGRKLFIRSSYDTVMNVCACADTHTHVKHARARERALIYTCTRLDINAEAVKGRFTAHKSQSSCTRVSSINRLTDAQR